MTYLGDSLQRRINLQQSYFKFADLNLHSSKPKPQSHFEEHSVFSEARALLNEWIANRCLLADDGLDMPAPDLSPLNIPSRLEIKKEWDHLIRCASKANDLQRDFSSPPLKDDIRRSPYENKPKNADRASKNSRPKSTTLDRILMRQEEARARRLLQTQERDAHLREVIIRREAEREALALLKQEEEQKLRKQKREEDLLQQEMIRVRKELKAENERQVKLRQLTSSSRERPVWSVEDHIQAEVDKYVPVDPTLQSAVGGSAPVYLETSLERSKTEKVQLETKLLLKRCLCAWRESTQDTRVRIYSQRALNEYRLKRAVLRTWRRLTVQERLTRELEAVKQFARELEKKESIADYFYETWIKRSCLLRWQGAIKLSKLTKATVEREELRRLKETQFLENLKTSSSRSNSTINESKPVRQENPINTSTQFGPPMSQSPIEVSESHAERPRILDHKTNSSCSIQTKQGLTRPQFNQKYYQTVSNCRLPEATVERPSLSKTVLKQRKRISAQNREIEELKAAKRYTELLLEASAHRMAGGLLQQEFDEKVIHGTQPSTRQEASMHGQGHESPLVQSARLPPSNALLDPQRDQASAPMRPRQSACSDGSAFLSDIPKSVSLPESTFLKRMKERELERARIRAEREERRRMTEEIKKAKYAKQLEDEARRLKEEKQNLIAAQKAKKREEEEHKRKHKLLIAQHRETLRKAAEHKRLQLQRYSGWLPWRRYIFEQRERLCLAKQHYEASVQRIALHTWLTHVRDKEKFLTSLVQRVYNATLLRRCFVHLRTTVAARQLVEAQAYAWYEQQLMLRILTAWSTHVTDCRICEWQMEDIAKAHRENHLKQRCLAAWINFPVLMRKQRERERRREQFRGRLRDLVPDFSPPKITGDLDD
ncbi:hypothetical protein EG68_04850 [Paragonimus skrjabini miyazakii]|uniref:Coiled-coil domain-containing protein KIAA1407 n=1 Tax=Paragonimus skrjabini miyazakii TaxID=59628 RepID=A0A8S9YRG9_9TREM|nr:hypothetical protein EG68_04850 [Paragonimus skrjabini miyazakii]